MRKQRLAPTVEAMLTQMTPRTEPKSAPATTVIAPPGKAATTPTM